MRVASIGLLLVLAKGVDPGGARMMLVCPLLCERLYLNAGESHIRTGARRDSVPGARSPAYRCDLGGCPVPVPPLLKFEPISAAQDPACVWAAVGRKRLFTIARRDPFFVPHVSWLNGSERRRIGRKFKTFEAAVRASVLSMLETGE